MVLIQGGTSAALGAAPSRHCETAWIGVVPKARTQPYSTTVGQNRTNQSIMGLWVSEGPRDPDGIRFGVDSQSSPFGLPEIRIAVTLGDFWQVLGALALAIFFAAG